MTTSNSQLADATVKELRRQYADGMKAVDILPPAKLFPSYAEKAAYKNMQTLGGEIERWAGTWRKWAEAGARDDGSRFSWETWFMAGKHFADAIKAHSDASYDANFFTGVVAPAAKQTAADVKDGAVAAAKAATKWMPIVLGVVGVVAVAVILTKASAFVPR